MRYIDNSRILYTFWGKYMDREQLTDKILKDALKFSKVSGQVLGQQLGYCLAELRAHAGKGGEQAEKSKVTAQFLKKNRNNALKIESEKSDSTKKSSKSSTSQGSESGEQDISKEDFSDVVFNTSADFNGHNFDLAINDELYRQKYKQLLINSSDEFPDRDHLFSFFRFYTISDEERKQLWKVRIGNTLRIDREVFENLKIRLKEEGLKKSVEKLVVDDMNRTLPNYKSCGAGQYMYENIQQLLLLFQVYRPDIGYVQGMSYLMVMFYYYFDEYESFVLFTNMVLTKNILSKCYQFDLSEVSPSKPDRRLQVDLQQEDGQELRGRQAAARLLHDQHGDLHPRLGLHHLHPHLQHQGGPRPLGHVPRLRRVLPAPHRLLHIQAASEGSCHQEEH